MLNIVCLKWGALYSAAYVNILFDMVRRNLMEGYKGRFICYTDDASGLDSGIEARELPKEFEGWWGKLWLFSRLKERTLYFDLDTVIVGALDGIAECKSEFATLRDFYRPNGLQSSVMAWQGDQSHIFESWKDAGYPRVEGGDQAWIEAVVKDPDILQDMYPGDFVSYKANRCEAGFPRDAKVVVFHGKPRPHEAGGWVEKVWKIGGGTAAELLLVANVEGDRIRQSVEINKARGLPEIKLEQPHKRAAVIVAGGPSLNEYLRQLHDGDLFAVNGTLAHLMRHGITPKYEVICDARPENVCFLNGAPVQYLLASQVAPILIDALEGQDVTLWHAAIPGDRPQPLQIGGASTVGLLSMVLAYVLGYREIHLYGFDSCYGESHHAYPQPLNDGERTLDVTVGNESFKCAPWMAQQGREFCEVAPELVRLGCEIAVHGYGLIPTIAQSMETPRIAADERAEAILERLPYGSLVGAEIGVFCGDLSRRLLQRDDLTLHMVDAWIGGGESYEGDSGDFHAALTQEQQDRCMQTTHSVTAFAGARARITKAFSHDAAATMPDASLDFVFIDADHGYDGCKRDLQAWWPKVKAGGLFSGHDYENTLYPKFGVKRAVDEFASERGLPVSLGANFTWFITKP